MGLCLLASVDSVGSGAAWITCVAWSSSSGMSSPFVRDGVDGQGSLGNEPPQRAGLRLPDEQNVQHVLDPVTGEPDLAGRAPQVASGLRVLLPVGHHRVHRHARGTAAQHARPRGRDAGRTHLRHRCLMGRLAGAVDPVDDRQDDGLGDHAGRHPGARRRRGDDRPVRTGHRTRNLVRRRERDARGEHVRVGRRLVGLGPIRGRPVLVRAGLVVGVHLEEAGRVEQLLADVVTVAVERLEVGTAERRQEHREIEREVVLGAVDLLVMQEAGLDLGAGGAQNRAHLALAEQRRRPQFGGGLEALLGEDQAADAEVAELGLVGEVDDLRVVPDARLAQRVVEVEGVFERGALARARAVARADDEAHRPAALELLDGGGQLLGGLGGVRGGAHREGVAGVRAETLGGSEVELRAGGVDEVVVLDRFLLALGAFDRRRDDDEGTLVPVATLRMNGRGARLMELDALAPVDGRERERHLALGHPADADPDVGRNPVPLGIRRNDDNPVFRPEQTTRVQRRRMPRDTRPENKQCGHVDLPDVVAQIPHRVYHEGEEILSATGAAPPDETRAAPSPAQRA